MQTPSEPQKPKSDKRNFVVGRSQVTRLGRRNWHWSDTYHWILTLSWPKFFVLIGGLYLAVNLIFATAFFIVPGSILNAHPGSYLDTFFFSIETLATVGYGYMSPATVYAHSVASTEILTGMLGIAVITGLLFARFSRPTARIMFSEVVVVMMFNGVPTLMLRAGNERNNLILEASIRMTLIRKEITLEGQKFYRFYDLKLERDRSSAFALSWTVMHKIDGTSPLFGKTHQDLLDDETEIYAAISGLDETLNDTVNARHGYGPKEIAFGSRFVDILVERQVGAWSVDFSKFHDIEPDGVRE